MPTMTVQKQDNVLHLSGVLNCDTLKQLWSGKQEFVSQITRIDVSLLTRVDSSGLALLTYFCIQYGLTLTSVNQQLKTLIELYDLNAVLV